MLRHLPIGDDLDLSRQPQAMSFHTCTLTVDVVVDNALRAYLAASDGVEDSRVTPMDVFWHSQLLPANNDSFQTV